MYNSPGTYQYPYNANPSMYNAYNNQFPWFANPVYPSNSWNQFPNQYYPYTEQPDPINPFILKDYGPDPFAVNIEEAAVQNDYFRMALWTGSHLQVTLMSINVGEDIGLEMHPNLDQFIRIEQGEGIVVMGVNRDNMDFQANVSDNFIFIVPAGTWHNLINTGDQPIKLYSIYAPPQHPFGTVHPTKEDAEQHHNH